MICCSWKRHNATFLEIIFYDVKFQILFVCHQPWNKQNELRSILIEKAYCHTSYLLVSETLRVEGSAGYFDLWNGRVSNAKRHCNCLIIFRIVKELQHGGRRELCRTSGIFSFVITAKFWTYSKLPRTLPKKPLMLPRRMSKMKNKMRFRRFYYYYDLMFVRIFAGWRFGWLRGRTSHFRLAPILCLFAGRTSN